MSSGACLIEIKMLSPSLFSHRLGLIVVIRHETEKSYVSSYLERNGGSGIADDFDDVLSVCVLDILAVDFQQSIAR